MRKREVLIIGHVPTKVGQILFYTMIIKKLFKKIKLKINKIIYRKKYIEIKKYYLWIFVGVSLACVFLLAFISYLLSVLGGAYVQKTIRPVQDVAKTLPNFNQDPLITVGKLRIKAVKPILRNYSPFMGNLKAPVKIFEFSDYECAYCAEVQKTLNQISKDYGDKVVLVWKDYPVSSIYPNSRLAAEAARCAQAQNKFWEFHDALYSRGDQELNENFYYQIAKDLKMDQEKFKECLYSNLPKQLVGADLQEGEDLQVYGVPMFYINDQEIFGKADYGDFKKAIDVELQKLGL